MNYKNLIFDVDGTLVDNELAVISAWKEMLKGLQNREYETEELSFVLGIPGEVTLAKFGVKDTRSAFQVWTTYFQKYRSTIRLFDGIPEVLEQLQGKGYNLGIVTSKTQEEFVNDTVLQQVAGYFDTVICVTDTPRPKPFPDPILAYLKKADVAPDETLYIGDTGYDSQCARSAGIDFGLAKWGSTSPVRIEAMFQLNTPPEILTVLNGK